jgi:sigma-B regulation protein RsbU (phosphoserine phosphatase)
LGKVESLKEEVNKLKQEKAAFQAQSRLLENFVSLAQSPGKETTLNALLQKTLEISAQITGAEKGSLFLLDSNEMVTDSILTRGKTSTRKRTKIIGKILRKGLAGWVRKNRRIGLVEDTREDNRWLDLPNQPYTVGSALSVPILRGDVLLGLLTLLHAKPGHFNDQTAELMQLTAAQIGAALENAQLYNKLDKYSKALDAELEKGKKIQRDFFPNEIPRLPGWEVVCVFEPALQVSGDFYDAFMLPEDSLGFVIADVCDKGVGSALYMALFRSFIRVFSGQIQLGNWSSTCSNESPETPDLKRSLQAVSLINDYIAEEHGHDGMFVTVFFGVLNPRTGELSYINAGHEPLYVIGSSGIKERLNAQAPPAGAMFGTKFTIERVKLEPGDTLIGYTDGVTEALSPEKELFTRERFLSLIDRPAVPASEMIERIKLDLFHHINDAPQFDDITMISIHRLP